MFNPSSSRTFAGLRNIEIDAILGAAVRRRYKSSETIIRAERPATHFVVVRTGNVDLCVVSAKGHEILIRRLAPGGAFGVAAFLSEPVGYLATATAVREVEVLTWEHRTVRSLSRMYPTWPENALRIALRYIAEYAERHLRLVSDAAQERLAHALMEVASRAGRLIAGGMEIDIKNEQLASLADVSLFTASRTLSVWERIGAVEKRRGSVLIRCPEKLLAEEVGEYASGIERPSGRTGGSLRS
jgi:CRP-like cAMP-binding protein